MRSNRINVFLMNLLDFRSLLGFLSLSWGKDLEHPVTGYSPLASSLFMNFKLSASWWKWQDSQTDNSLLSACFLSVYGEIPKIITPSASCLYMARFLNWLLSCLLSVYGSLTLCLSVYGHNLKLINLRLLLSVYGQIPKIISLHLLLS